MSSEQEREIETLRGALETAIRIGETLQRRVDDALAELDGGDGRKPAAVVAAIAILRGDKP